MRKHVIELPTATPIHCAYCERMPDKSKCPMCRGKGYTLQRGTGKFGTDEVSMLVYDRTMNPERFKDQI